MIARDDGSIEIYKFNINEELEVVFNEIKVKIQKKFEWKSYGYIIWEYLIPRNEGIFGFNLLGKSNKF